MRSRGSPGKDRDLNICPCHPTELALIALPLWHPSQACRPEQGWQTQSHVCHLLLLLPRQMLLADASFLSPESGCGCTVLTSVLQVATPMAVPG